MKVGVAALWKKLLHKTHYVCQDCGKDMGRIWDIVCKECDGTFCYDCAYTDDQYWYCRAHAPETAAKFLVCGQEDRVMTNREELSTT